MKSVLEMLKGCMKKIILKTCFENTGCYGSYNGGCEGCPVLIIKIKNEAAAMVAVKGVQRQ